MSDIIRVVIFQMLITQKERPRWFIKTATMRFRLTFLLLLTNTIRRKRTRLFTSSTFRTAARAEWSLFRRTRKETVRQKEKKESGEKDFGDGSYIRYDKESKQLDIVSDSVHMEGLSVSGNLSVSGSINAGSITTGGNVHIKGNLTVDGSYPK